MNFLLEANAVICPVSFGRIECRRLIAFVFGVFDGEYCVVDVLRAEQGLRMFCIGRATTNFPCR
jgi:hypothetical protein